MKFSGICLLKLVKVKWLNKLYEVLQLKCQYIILIINRYGYNGYNNPNYLHFLSFWHSKAPFFRAVPGAKMSTNYLAEMRKDTESTRELESNNIYILYIYILYIYI